MYSTVELSLSLTSLIMQSVLIKGGVFILGVILYTSLCSWDHAQRLDQKRCPGSFAHFLGTMHSVLIKGGVLISKILSYTHLMLTKCYIMYLGGEHITHNYNNWY